MSLSLIISINVLADIALLGGLAYAMSHARRLTPHVASIQLAEASPAERSLASLGEPRRAHVAHAGFARPRASTVQRAGGHGAAAHESAS